jgi:hypothetical protein
LNVSISSEGALLAKRAAAYHTESTSPADIEIVVPMEHLVKMQQSFPNLTAEECAYIFAGEEFHQSTIEFDCFRLHASAVVLDGKAYLFSAPSGTGKSTHTSLWCNYFGQERTYILNDDMPVIRRIGDQFIAYGTPWSGTSPMNRNASAPLKAIAFIERARENWIRPALHNEGIINLFSHTIKMRDQECFERFLSLFDAFMNAVPIYSMGCTISYQSVEMAYAEMSR